MKKMRYNALYLYMEDVYEIDGEPYFGHQRGRYTHAGLKDIDNYCHCYWDYYSQYKREYDVNVEAHKILSKDICFAGGAWSWCGFAPDNKKSLKFTKSALLSMHEHGIDNVFLTLWGGRQQRMFAVCPAPHPLLRGGSVLRQF